MSFVITQGCCSDGACVSVCPVQCIRPRPGDPDFTHTEQLYIDPVSCIDCGACMDECPVEAVHPDWELPDKFSDYASINSDYFVTNPIEGLSVPSFTRRVLPTGHSELRVAVVGAGPAGSYATGILSEIAGVSVSLFDRLPTPFGLVRGGVAPDHLETKKMADRFATYLARPAVDLYLNVSVGTDISLQELLEHHHAVIWAVGAGTDRTLGVPGEDLPGSHAARDFVAWYNGHPDHEQDSYDLSHRRVVVIGNGNVALDVARVMLRDTETLRHTDMADRAVAVIGEADVREVVVVGRRGPEHAAHSLGEILAIDGDAEITVVADPREVLGHPVADRRAAVLTRAAARSGTTPGRALSLRFGLVPVSVDGPDRVRSVTFRRPDGSTETIETGMVLRATGYRGMRPDPIMPFDEATATLPHDAGRVVDPDTGFGITGAYCTGWIKRGPRGTIGTNKPDAQETVDSILQDLTAGRLAPPTGSRDDLGRLLRDRVAQLVDKTGWRRIDAAERQLGAAQSRVRTKLGTIPELLDAAGSRQTE